MDRALQRTNNDTLEISDRGSDSLSRVFHKRNDFKSSSEVHRQSSPSWRNSDSRCAVLTFLTLEPNGHWRIVALPLHHPDQSNCVGYGAQLRMDCLHMVSPQPINSVQIDRQKVSKGGAQWSSFSANSLTNRSFLNSSVQHQSRSKVLANTPTWNECSKNFSQKSLKSSESSCLVTSSSSNCSSKVDNVVKRSSRKKTKKKGKRGKKNLCTASSMEPEVLSEEYPNYSSTSETCHGNDVDGKDVPEEEVHDSETIKTCISYNDGLDMLNSKVNFKNQTQSENSAESVCESKMHDPFVLDSVSSCSNSDDGTKFRPGSSSREGSVSCKSMLNDIGDASNHTKRMSKKSDGTDRQVLISGKKNKRRKKVSQISSVPKFRSMGSLHGRTGKENIQSVWQKVQKNGTNDSIDELRKATLFSQFDVTPEEPSLLERTCNSVEEKRQSKYSKVSRKLKSKGGAALKQESNFAIGKGSDRNMGILGSSETSDLLSKGHDQTLRTNVVSGFECQEVKHIKSESVNSMHKFVSKMGSFESECTIEDQTNSLPKSCDSEVQSKLSQVQSPLFAPHHSGPDRHEQDETRLAENGIQNQNSRCIMQKWVPIKLKDLGSTNTTDSSSPENSDDPALCSQTMHDPAVQSKLDCHSRIVVCRAEVTCMDQSSEAVTCSSLNPSMLEEQKNGNTKAHCLNAESRAVNAFQAVSDRIGEAVSDAFRARLASEAVEQATGNPIAEFERLLHHSSPDISNHFDYVCHTCSEGQVGDVSLCRHEIPNVSLGCLWQWYEKHGNYGLEIRAEDYENTKRLGADRFSFRAYFVPYLSAVQLFRNRDQSVDTDNVVSSPGTCEKASNVCHLPILPILFPQPRKDLESFAPCLNQVGSPEPSSSSAHDVAPLQSAESALSSDAELLLEYFETDQPQQRRPLYEKIKELVRGDGPSQHKVYGDHTILDSIKLNDLHPRSWYAVAWYPIYRIPEGNLRAAFLTFHSLGHLIRGTGSATFDSEVGKNCIVAPVVGLQSYNAQGECWFQLRRSATKLNPAGILKERLRTLDMTASLMARAVVNKANISSVNWHSDYEFFSSRQRR
ncbi:hypothetical protein UlMin_009101 [Ulmus minor]